MYSWFVCLHSITFVILCTLVKLTVGTAKYIMMTLEIALAFRKSDMAPVIIPPAEISSIIPTRYYTT